MFLFNPIGLKMKKTISSYSYANNVISGFNEALIDTGPQISSSLIPYDNTTFCLYGNSSNDYITNYQSHFSNIFSESTSILQDPFQEERQLNLINQPWDSISLQQSNNGGEDRRRLKRFQEQQPRIQTEKVRRRSHKLTDKITALQKLVSPYGKTDTASVLLEASISIKALQDQIKELFQLISVQETTNTIGEKGMDLQSRGLCLVFLEELKRRPQ